MKRLFGKQRRRIITQMQLLIRVLGAGSPSTRRDLYISVLELDTTLNEFKIYPFRKEKFTVSTMMEEFLATIPLLMLKVLKKPFGHTDIAVHRA